MTIREGHEGSNPSGRTINIRMNRWLFWIAVVIIASLLFNYSSSNYIQSLVAPTLSEMPSYIYATDPTKATTILHVGDHYFVRTYNRRSELCSVIIQYSLVQYRSFEGLPVRRMMHSYPIIFTRTLLGDTITDRELTVPNLPSGDYNLIRQSSFTCRNVKIERDTEPVYFRIE